MTRIASDGAAGIHARADATNLTVGTNDSITWPGARALFALLPRGTHHGDARDIDAKTIRRAYFTWSANEFATITFRNARPFVAHFARITKITFVGDTTTIVIESVAFFNRRLIRLHARERSALALHRSIGANTRFASIARSTAARTRDSRDERREIIEIVVSAGQQIFPAEVKGILRRGAVVNQQVNERIRLIAIWIVLFLAVEDVIVVSGRRTIGHAFVKPNFTTRITRIVLDIERLRRTHTIGTREKFMQVGIVRLLPRHVVPAERVLIARITLEHGERQTTRRNERLGRRRRLRKSVDGFAAARKLVLQAIAHGNRRSVGLLQGEGLGRSDCCEGKDGGNERKGSFAHPAMLDWPTRHYKRSLGLLISWRRQHRKQRGRRF